jgi:(2Fe-2S) ferredoxin
MAHKKKHHGKKLQARAAKRSIGKCRHHVFLCVGADCCNGHSGKAAWKALKRSLKEHKLDDGTVLRTKVDCLGLCCSGPVAVVYPEGTWYAELNADRVPKFVAEHLADNRPIADWIFAQNSSTDSHTHEDY